MRHEHDKGLTDMLARSKGVRLDASSRARIRAALEAYAAAHPAGTGRMSRGPVPSPLWAYWRVHRSFSVVFAGLLIAVSVGGGTSYAAEGALPGDLLYPIKVLVNEPVRVALASSPEARANVEAELAERRLEEADKLASRGTLATATAVRLKADFDEHEHESRRAAESLRGRDPERAERLHAALEARIAAKAAILMTLAEGEGEARAIVLLAASSSTEASPGDGEGAGIAREERDAKGRKVRETRVFSRTLHEEVRAGHGTEASVRTSVSATTSVEIRIQKKDDGQDQEDGEDGTDTPAGKGKKGEQKLRIDWGF